MLCLKVEKGEAVRQNLEYELAKSKRDLGMEKRNFQERENSSAEVMDSLKRKYTHEPPLGLFRY